MGRVKKQKNRLTKRVLVFDEEARKDWLTGFRKRKNERRKKAADDLQKQLKEELKRKKQEHKDMVKKSQQKYMDRLAEVERILEAKTYSLDTCGTAEVTVTELDNLQDETRLGLNLAVDANDESNLAEAAEVISNHSCEEGDGASKKKQPAKGHKLRLSKKAAALQAKLLKLHKPRQHGRSRHHHKGSRHDDR